MSAFDGNAKQMKMLTSVWHTRYGRIRFRLMDVACIGYLVLIGFCLILFHKSVDVWPRYVAVHIVLAILILEFVRFAERHPQHQWVWFLRTFYPIAVFLIGWSTVNAIVRMFFGTFWFTETAIQMDKFLFGVHPTVWIQQFYSPWLDELMNIFYASYYLFLPSVVLVLYIKGKRTEAFAAFSFLSVTLLSNYALFYLLPCLSPSMAGGVMELHTKTQSGYFFAWVIRTIQSSAFPSSHISEVFVLSLVALRYVKQLGYILLPLTFGVSISTVYLRYHHAVDPLFGYVWGTVCFLFTLRLLKFRGEDPLSITPAT
jgi:membrane-associated phospholipid phosphatase